MADKLFVIAKLELSSGTQLRTAVVLPIADRQVPVSTICSELEQLAAIAINASSAAPATTYTVCRGTSSLHFQGVPIKHEHIDRSIDSYIPVNKGVIAGFAIHMQAKAEPYTVKVMTPASKEPIMLQVDGFGESIQELKRKIKEHTGPDTLICQQRLSCKVNGEAKILIDKNMSLADHGVLDNSEIYVDLDPELGFKLSVLHEGRLSTLTLEDGDKSNPAKCYNVVDVACAYKRSTGSCLSSGCRFFFGSKPLSFQDVLSEHKLKSGSQLKIKACASFHVQAFVKDKAGIQIASFQVNSTTTVADIRAQLEDLLPHKQQYGVWIQSTLRRAPVEFSVKGGVMVLDDSQVLGNYATRVPWEDKGDITLRLDYYEDPAKKMQIFFKHVTGVTIILEVKITDSIEQVKQTIQDQEDIPTDLMTVIFEGRQLEDGIILGDYQIYHGSTLILMVRPFMSVADSDGLGNESIMSQTSWSLSAPDWRRASPGLCLEGTCTNANCKAFGKTVVHNAGFTHFDVVLNEANNECKCPRCEQPVVPVACAFNSCQWMYTGVKLSAADQQLQVKCKGWHTTRDCYDRFDDSTFNKVGWSRLLITARPSRAAHNIADSDVEVSECAICLEHEADCNMVTTPCEHPHHKECLDAWLQLSKHCCLCSSDISAMSIGQL